MKRLILLLYGIFCGVPIAHGQHAPIKWGTVSIEDLRMQSFRPDSNASAVILCDYGESTFNNDFNIVFKRHRRIKILTKAGYDWGTHAFSIVSKDRAQRVEDIEGATYTLEPDDKVKTYELDSESIYEEDDAKTWKRYRFTLPALSPGCVIEYRYTILSKYWDYLQDWEFQTSEPTLWSEYRAQIPEMLKYASVSQGFEKFHLNEKKNFKQTVTYMTKSREGTFYQKRTRWDDVEFDLTGVEHRWIMKDVPALREEPFMTTPKDFTSKISFQLSRIDFPGEIPQSVLKSWEAVVRELLKSKYFGGQLDGYRSIRRQSEAVVSGIEDPTTRLQVVYKFVQQSMRWNERYRLTTEKDLDDVLEAKTGNSAEINLLLAVMLKASGIEAHPVILSTRSHGKIQQMYPLVSQFNHAIIYASIGEKEFLMDATDPQRPIHLLPYEALNHTGLLVKDGPPEWIVIQPQGKYSRRSVATMSLASDGSLKGSVQISDVEYSALRRRNSLKSDKEDEFLKSYLRADELGLAVDSFSINNKDNIEESLMTQAYVASSTYAQQAGNFLYVNPVIFGRTKESSLKLKERKFPIDFAYERDESFSLTLSLSNDLIVKDRPANTSLKLPNNSGEYVRLVEAEGPVLQYRSRFQLRKETFEPEEYKALQEFFDRIVTLEAEPIVIQRNSPRK